MKRRPSQPGTDALEFAPAILAVQHKPPAALPRVMLYSVTGLFATLLIWAAVGRLDIIAVAEGKLVPQTYLKIVQPADAGIVQEILIKEGQMVEAEQVLMRMDSRLAEADTRVLDNELTLKALQLRRIDAELADIALIRQGGEPLELFKQIEAQWSAHRQAYQDALAQEQAALAKTRQDLAAAKQIQAKLEQVVPVYQTQAQAFEKLSREGFASNLMVLDKQREHIEKERDLRSQTHTVASLKATITQSEKRIAQISSTYRQQLQNERVETEAQYQKLQQDRAKQEHKNKLLELKAPQRGIIKDIATHTRGAVVSPGTILMTLVPQDEPLQAEVMIRNEDVGFIHENQNVKLKLAAYPFQKYGMLDGVVSQVGADATDRASIDNEPGYKGDPFTALSSFKALISLKTQSLDAGGERFKLAPGMQVAAEINLGSRTVLEYLLSPLQKAFHEAGRER